MQHNFKYWIYTWLSKAVGMGVVLLMGSVSYATAVQFTNTPTPAVTTEGTATATPTITATVTVSPTVTATATVTPSVTQTTETETFHDDFTSGFNTGGRPAGWFDAGIDTSSYVTFRYANTLGLVNLVQMDNQYPAKALTQYLSTGLITQQTHMLEVKVQSVSSGKVSLGVYLQDHGPYKWPLRITGPGTYSVNLHDLDWTGHQQFQILLFIEGNTSSELGSAVIDSVRITNRVAPIMTPTPYAGPYTVGWVCDFSDLSQWVSPGVDFNAHFNITNVPSYARLTRAGYYPSRNWGQAISQPITVNTDIYKELTVDVGQVTASTGWKVLIQIPPYNVSSTEPEFTELCSSQNGTGRYTFNFANARNWSGTHKFYVVLIVEGAVGKNVVFHSVAVHSAVTAPTPTVTPTPDQTNAWEDHFLGAPGVLVGGWTDATVDAAYNAAMQYSYTESQGILTRSANSTWGKALAPSVTLDTDVYSKLEVNVAKLSPSGTWKIGIQETEGAWRYWDLSGSSSNVGTFTFDYTTITGLSGVKRFAVQLVLEGNAGEYAEFGHVRFFKTGIPFTRTVTPTSTNTATCTMTSTATPTVTVTPYVGSIFAEEFSEQAGFFPANWVSNTMINASFTTTGSTAVLARAQSGIYGRVLSRSLECDSSVYPVVEVRVTSITASTTWKIGIQDIAYPYHYWDLNTSSSETGTFAFNVNQVMGWTGVHDFYIQLTVEGESGTSVEFDWVRIGQPGSVHGASVRTAGLGTKFMVSSPTFTPTPSPTITATATAEATSSPTSTPTIGVKVDEGQVVAFPNPARGKVAFAYAAPGVAKVKIDIYRLTGERVASLEERKDGSAQTFTTAWEAAGVAPGIYFCRIVATDASGKEVLNVKKKVALVK